MQFSSISSGLEVFDLRHTSIDLTSIGNRRFMYHPNGWLILGAEDVITKKGAKLLSSHAEEYHEATLLCRNLPAFDSFLRGWIGIGGAYKSGIIHFAPCISADNIEMFEKAFSFIEAALENGFTTKAILRGFPGAWEQSVKSIFPEPKESLDDKISLAQKKAVKSEDKKKLSLDIMPGEDLLAR